MASHAGRAPVTGARIAFFLICLLALSLPGWAGGPALLQALDAWVRQVPGSDVAAAYLTLHNAGDHPLSVVAVESPLATSAMIHETKIEGGMSRMRPQTGLVVGPGQTVKLAPGGMHIMLMDVKPLAVGQRVPLVLKLADGSSVRVEAPVRPLGAP
jgi:periplasmic copper chaperone A